MSKQKNNPDKGQKNSHEEARTKNPQFFFVFDLCQVFGSGTGSGAIGT